MAGSNNDINSTEKLLNVIRGKDKESFTALGNQKVSLSQNKPGKKINITFPSFSLDKKIYTVGVDINQEFICLVKTARNSDGKPVLVDQKIIKYGPQSSNFNTFLKSSLAAFCGPFSNCNIWAKISSSDVNVYFMKVPRVPKKQLENVIYWTAKKEGFLDEEKLIIDFELQGEILDQDKPKYSVMVYTANKNSVEGIKALFFDIGITLAGITTVPFAVQNIFRSKWLSTNEEIFASLFIGNNYSRIDIYKKDNLVMSRGIKTGSINSMVESISASALGKTGNTKLNNEEARKILLNLSVNAEDLKNKDTGYGFTKEEILEMISPVWERLARQVDLTLKTSTIEYQKVEKIYIISSVKFDNSILDYMGDRLGSKTEFFNPFKQITTSPKTESLNIAEKMFLSPALGFALSDNRYTPNVIYTYQEKNRETSARLANKVVFSVFAALLIVCLVTLIYKGMEVSAQKKQKSSLEKEIALCSPLITKEKISQLTEEVNIQKQGVYRYAQRYLGAAVIGEVADLTPQNIRLISFKIKEGDSSATAAADKPVPQTNAAKTPQASIDGVTIEGVVFGERNMLESLLSQYVTKLESSPILEKVSIQKNSIVTFKKGEVLQFVLNAKTG